MMISKMISLTNFSLAFSSSTITNALFCASISIVMAMTYRSLRHRLLLPPGPWFLQLRMVYYMLTMRLPCRLEKIYEAQSKKYGKMFSFSLGSDIKIVISDPDIIREAFGKHRDAFSDRRSPSVYAKSFGGEHSKFTMEWGHCAYPVILSLSLVYDDSYISGYIDR